MLDSTVPADRLFGVIWTIDGATTGKDRKGLGKANQILA